VEDPKLMS